MDAKSQPGTRPALGGPFAPRAELALVLASSRWPQLEGDRTEIRDRSTTVAMHLLRRVLSGDEVGV